MKCQHLNIDVEASAVNRLFSLNLNGLGVAESIPNQLFEIENATTINVDGRYRVAARFCSPLHDIPERRETLQILVHGITYTKDYWSGPSTQDIGPGSTNRSWVYYAAEQGYSVLAVDRLCSGQSSHPAGILECQLPLEAAILEKIMQAARDGALPSVATKFRKIIYVGHSYGSLIGNWIAQSNPTAADQLHLTGFSERLLVGSPSILVGPVWLPASLLDSARFIGLDLGYLMATSREGTERVFFSDDMDPAVLDRQWETRGTVTIGEILTAMLGQGSAPEFKGDIFVVNGDEDALFCASDPITAAKAKKGACEDRGVSKNVADSYPAARRFGYLNLPKIGHSLGVHKDASRAIAASHEFMAASGF